MSYLHRILIVSFILISSVACDQVTKIAATDSLADQPPISMLGDTFRLHYAENTGAMLSLGSTLSSDARTWIFQVGVFVMLLALLIFTLVQKRLDKAQIIALSLVVGGGIGNLIDRVFNEGAVVDFMNIGIGSLRTGIFNVADVAIMVGIGIIFVHTLVVKPPDDEEEKDAAPA